jgi:prepilin-type N-terminal cleavage/methylation domain-containing protein
MIGQRRSIRSSLLEPRGFTLVELLVTLTILGILASVTVFAMAAASETAKAAKTRSLIAKLDALLMDRWQSYQSRRVPLLGNTLGMKANQVTKLRLAGLRELMLIELPDRWEDVNYTPQTIHRTALAAAYKRRFDNNINPISGSPENPTPRYQGAECLYLIISMATGDGEAMEQFTEKSIGDVDQDGALEFVDAWGNPVRFLRWPAGFVSDLQPLAEPALARDPEGDHDPFDPFLRDPKAYRLVPLVYSAGSDEVYDVVVNTEVGFAYPGPLGFLDPYTIINPSEPVEDQVMRGTQKDVDGDGEQGWADNIHNHLIGSK